MTRNGDEQGFVAIVNNFGCICELEFPSNALWAHLPAMLCTFCSMLFAEGLLPMNNDECMSCNVLADSYQCIIVHTVGKSCTSICCPLEHLDAVEQELQPVPEDQYN